MTRFRTLVWKASDLNFDLVRDKASRQYVLTKNGEPAFRTPNLDILEGWLIGVRYGSEAIC